MNSADHDAMSYLKHQFFVGLHCFQWLSGRPFKKGLMYDCENQL